MSSISDRESDGYQMQTENQLLEEKERYRIAVESSQDAFLPTNVRKLLEIVNSKGNDGVWDCGSIRNFLIMTVSIRQIRQSW